MEADAAADPVRSRRGAASPRATSSTAEPSSSQQRQKELAAQLGWKASAIARARAGACPTATGWRNRSPGRSPTPGRSRRAEAHFGDATPNVVVDDDPESGATRVSVFTPDREGLFYRICAGIAAAGASIVDARIHTTRDGMALDNLLVHDSRGQPYADRRLRERLGRSIEAALTGKDAPPVPASEPSRPRSGAFDVAPSVAVAERASSRTTVVEVNARDRPALLAALAAAIHGEGQRIHSAHIATYGERAVDVFYVTRADGRKLEVGDVEALKSALMQAAAEPAKAKAA